MTGGRGTRLADRAASPAVAVRSAACAGVDPVEAADVGAADIVGPADLEVGAVCLDHRVNPRRRGEELCSAIFAATLAELDSVGYAALTMEGIAARARASKGSLYRRWANRAELVADAVESQRPAPLFVPDTGRVRADLLGFLRGFADWLNSPHGVAIHGLMVETMRDAQLRELVQERFVEPARALLLTALDRAAARGEVRRAAVHPLVATVGPIMLRDHFLTSGGAPIPESVLVEIVDEVLMPLVAAGE